MARVRYQAAACCTLASGWAELYAIAEAGTLAELATLEAAWADDDDRGQEAETALELLRTAAGMRYPPDAGEEWREK